MPNRHESRGSQRQIRSNQLCIGSALLSQPLSVDDHQSVQLLTAMSGANPAQPESTGPSPVAVLTSPITRDRAPIRLIGLHHRQSIRAVSKSLDRRAHAAPARGRFAVAVRAWSACASPLVSVWDQRLSRSHRAPPPRAPDPHGSEARAAAVRLVADRDRDTCASRNHQHQVPS